MEVETYNHILIPVINTKFVKICSAVLEFYKRVEEEDAKEIN
jgi:DNA-binding cell septation regulator SpoVG